MSNQIEDFYQQRSNDRLWDPFRQLNGRDKDIFPLVPQEPGTFLEYGFGSGSLFVPIARASKKAIGVEISQHLIDHCRGRVLEVEPNLLPRIKWIKTDGGLLSMVQDASVDLIVCAAVIEHVFDPYQLLDIFRRIAKPEATLILTTPNFAYLKNRLTLLMGDLPKTGTDDPIHAWRACGWDGGHLHYFTKNTLTQLLDDCGWCMEKCLGTGDRWPWMRPLRRRFPALLSGELIVTARAIPVS